MKVYGCFFLLPFFYKNATNEESAFQKRSSAMRIAVVARISLHMPTLEKGLR